MTTISASTTTTTAYVCAPDTTGTLVLQTGSTPTTAVTIGTNQTTTFAQTANLPNTFGFKNRIINGGMVIDQRNSGASVAAANAVYTIDRWCPLATTNSKFNVGRNLNNVTPPVGFSNYLGCQTSSAVTPGATDSYSMIQWIEGYNIADLGFGTANAKTVTLSFQVYSSLTGTFSGSIGGYNLSTFRSYVFSYSIPVANTWTTVSVTIPGDTTTFAYGTTNTYGIFVIFDLGSGSSVRTAAGSWNSGLYYGAPGAVSPISTLNATWYVTGVQLEQGSIATSFDFRPYGVELNLCQRYYWRGWQAHSMNTGSYTTGCIVSFPVQYTVPMRTNPTIGQSIAGITYGGTSGFTAVASANNNAGRVNVTTTATTTNAYFVMGANDYIDATAEL